MLSRVSKIVMLAVVSSISLFGGEAAHGSVAGQSKQAGSIGSKTPQRHPCFEQFQADLEYCNEEFSGLTEGDLKDACIWGAKLALSECFDPQ